MSKTERDETTVVIDTDNAKEALSQAIMALTQEMKGHITRRATEMLEAHPGENRAALYAAIKLKMLDQLSDMVRGLVIGSSSALASVVMDVANLHDGSTREQVEERFREGFGACLNDMNATVEHALPRILDMAMELQAKRNKVFQRMAGGLQ